MTKSAPQCPGPDENLRKPQFQVPRGSWDTIAHIFGPFERFPLSADRSYTPFEFPLPRYIELLDSLGFDHGVLVQGGAHGKDNRALVDALRAEPVRLRGVAVMEAGRPKRELLEMDQLGVRGVRMSTVVGGGVNFEELPSLAQQVAPLGWHVMLHFLNATELLDVEAYLSRSPAKVVLDHMARIQGGEGVESAPFHSLLRLLEGGNCWVKLSSLYRLSNRPYPFDDMPPMINKVLQCRPDRVLWGSNWPHAIHWGTMPNDADLVDLIPLWIPDERIRQMVLVENPLVLYR